MQSSTNVSCGMLLAAALGCNTMLNIEEATLCADGCDAGAAPLGPVQTLYETPDRAASMQPSGARLDAGSAADGAATCSVPTPALARDCASCGGEVECDGSCSVQTPANLAQACGACGGRIDCNGNCSIATPSDYGSILLRDTEDRFSCCLIDETRSYGPDGRDTSGCYPGYTYAGCTVSKISGGGSVSIASDDPASCTCRVRVSNSGLEGATYAVHIRFARSCN